MNQCRAEGCCPRMRWAVPCIADIQSYAMSEGKKREKKDYFLLQVVKKMPQRVWSLHLVFSYDSLWDTGQIPKAKLFIQGHLSTECSSSAPCPIWNLGSALLKVLITHKCKLKLKGAELSAHYPMIKIVKKIGAACLKLDSQISRRFQLWFTLPQSPSVKWGQ